MDLVNAHKTFFDEIEKIDPTLTLPTPCPLENISNMKTAYARLLYVLNKAIDPHEQATHLQQLDFGMQGVICEASRGGPYLFLGKEMDITPVSGVTNWANFAKYAPIQKEHHGTIFFTTTERQVTDFTDQGYRACYVMRPEFINPYPWEREILLTRDEHGYLVTKERTLLDFLDEYGDWETKRINDPEILDEAYMTRSNSLAYNMDMQQLINLCDNLLHPENLRRYFYRYVGTQPFTFKFEVYKNLMGQLSVVQLGNNDAERTKNMQKKLIPILAMATMGSRVLQSNRDIESDCAEFLNFIKINAITLEENAVLKYFVENYHDINPGMTFKEINAILSLIKDTDCRVANNSLIVLSNRQNHVIEKFYNLITNLCLHPITTLKTVRNFYH